jgi:hypothetical protein
VPVVITRGVASAISTAESSLLGLPLTLMLRGDQLGRPLQNASGDR